MQLSGQHDNRSNVRSLHACTITHAKLLHAGTAICPSIVCIHSLSLHVAHQEHTDRLPLTVRKHTMPARISVLKVLPLSRN
jgi:hypothetical protein